MVSFDLNIFISNRGKDCGRAKHGAIPCDQDLGVLISKSYINNYIVMGAENSRFEEQVAKAGCECPLHYSSTIIKIIALHFHLDYNVVCNSGTY